MYVGDSGWCSPFKASDFFALRLLTQGEGRAMTAAVQFHLISLNDNISAGRPSWPKKFERQIPNGGRS
jgi:hypothetical protein